MIVFILGSVYGTATVLPGERSSQQAAETTTGGQAPVSFGATRPDTQNAQTPALGDSQGGTQNATENEAVGPRRRSSKEHVVDVLGMSLSAGGQGWNPRGGVRRLHTGAGPNPENKEAGVENGPAPSWGGRSTQPQTSTWLLKNKTATCTLASHPCVP